MEEKSAEKCKNAEGPKLQRQDTTSTGDYVPGEITKRYEKKLREEVFTNAIAVFKKGKNTAMEQKNYAAAAEFGKWQGVSEGLLIKLKEDRLTDEEWNVYLEACSKLFK